MFEPVTMTRSTSATPADEGTASSASVPEDSSKPIVAMPHPPHQMNGRLIQPPLVRPSALYQISSGNNKPFPGNDSAITVEAAVPAALKEMQATRLRDASAWQARLPLQLMSWRRLT